MVCVTAVPVSSNKCVFLQRPSARKLSGLLKRFHRCALQKVCRCTNRQNTVVKMPKRSTPSLNHQVPQPTTTLSSLSQAFLPSLLINEGKRGLGRNHSNARAAGPHGSWCFEGRVVRTACTSGSKSRNRASCRESWDMDRDSAQRHLRLETPSLLTSSSLELLFLVCVCH